MLRAVYREKNRFLRLRDEAILALPPADLERYWWEVRDQHQTLDLSAFVDKQDRKVAVGHL